MQIASASLAVERTSTSNNTLEYPKTTWYPTPAAAKPRTFVEQYWAARALVAETVLTTRVQHQKEMAEVRLGMEEKQTNQFAALMRANEQRQSRLEKSVAVLITCFMLLFLGLIYILLRDSPKSKAASHFTIPILSPFTSVVSFVNRRCKVWIISNGIRSNMKRALSVRDPCQCLLSF
jgi:C4-dicarboxylate-specific signal transduction histidine kinase